MALLAKGRFATMASAVGLLHFGTVVAFAPTHFAPKVPDTTEGLAPLAAVAAPAAFADGQGLPTPRAENSSTASASLVAAGVVLGAVSALALVARRSATHRLERRRTPVVVHAFEGQVGVQVPVGSWDPLGIASAGDAADLEKRRAVELKHGRISMFACNGYMVPDYVEFLGQDRARAPVDFEKYGSLGGQKNFLFNFTAMNIADPEVRKKTSNTEIANGRLAMMAISGMFCQDGLTGSAQVDWSTSADSSLRAFEEETGVQPPVGFWDPLGLSNSGNKFDFVRRREVELKHGRVSMFATIGYIVPEYYRFEGFLSPSYGIKFADIPNGLAALGKIPALGILNIVSFIGGVELFVYDKETGEPGNYASGFLALRTVGIQYDIKNKEARKTKLNAELANGRLAMVAIIGMFFQDGCTGSAWGDWALYTDSPLRAFEEETGVQAPVGFWDPLGLSSSGNKSDFVRRREVELKHGRVSMFATIGYIVPEYYRFEGFLSPSYGIKFADIPNGLAALGKIPAIGVLNIVSFIGAVELFVYDKETGEPGNYASGFLALRTVGIQYNIKDPETRKTKLNAELANGRLAMVAIIGMFFQDGCTGSAWGDWALYTDSPLRAFESELRVQDADVEASRV